MSEIRKSVLAGLEWLAGVLLAAYIADGDLTIAEILAALGSTPVAGWIVWRVPNKQPTAQ